MPANAINAALRGLAVVAAAVLITACGQGTGSPDGDPGHDEDGSDPGLAHVHGLGIDPQDGTLYAASHYGVFQVPADGKPQRIADRRQDTMGFTVVGPRHFLASGHPDPKDTDQPANLGLIESVDAGQTWQALSLAGEADFHALEAKHDLVYGYNSQSGQLMVSDDRQTWDHRAELAMADFAVHPTDPETLLATTQEGLARSTDGGRTFGLVADAPLLQLIDWPAEDTLVGVNPNGAVHTSSDGGTTWTTQGQVPGQPQAIVVAGEPAEVHVATEAGIHTSTDGGRTFARRS